VKEFEYQSLFCKTTGVIIFTLSGQWCGFTRHPVVDTAAKSKSRLVFFENHHNVFYETKTQSGAAVDYCRPI